MASQPRLNKTQQEAMNMFGFEFAEAPERDNSRRSRYDDLWTNARLLLMQYPGRTLKTRVHNSSSAAYDEAKKINNGEHRMFKEDAELWTAVAAPSSSPDEVNEDGKPLTAIYLTYKGDVPE